MNINNYINENNSSEFDRGYADAIAEIQKQLHGPTTGGTPPPPPPSGPIDPRLIIPVNPNNPKQNPPTKNPKQNNPTVNVTDPNTENQKKQLADAAQEAASEADARSAQAISRRTRPGTRLSSNPPRFCRHCPGRVTGRRREGKSQKNPC